MTDTHTQQNDVPGFNKTSFIENKSSTKCNHSYYDAKYRH